MIRAMDTQGLICCPACDAVYSVVQPRPGDRATCARCHRPLIVPRHKAGKQIIAVALTMLILAIAACFLPFIEIGVAGARNETSIFGIAQSFERVHLSALSLAVAALIVVIPVTRVLLVLYVLVPVVRDKPPAPHARAAFRLSESLRPWAMAEVFALGCAVALVKVGDLATVGLGPAFWMFGVVAGLLVIQDNFMCRWSVWRSLDTPSPAS